MKQAIFAGMVFSLFVSLIAGLQLIDLATGNFFPDPGPDLPRIYIRSDGSIEPATAPVARSGSLYKLTGNISMYTVEIQQDNIILDGSDYLISGNASWMGTAPHWRDAGNNGIIITGQNNITLTRLNIEKCTTGVRISNSSHINLIGNMFTNETAAMGIAVGIGIKDSSFVLIEDNHFTSAQGPAIACNGTNNIIRRNTLTGVRGIDLEGSSNLVSDNKIEVILPIVMDKADSNIIARNEISGPTPSLPLPSQDQNRTGNEGIAFFVNCSNNVIFRNNITGFVNQAIRTVFSCSNNTFYDNYLSNNGFAIVLQDGAVNNMFYGNTFAADSYKIQINDCVEDTFWDNGTIGNYWGNYNGTDSNKDGIGDTPYTVNGYKWDTNVDGFVSFISGQDNYPLMANYNINNTTLEPSSSLHPTSPAPSPSIPEFPVWIILPAIMVITLITLILVKNTFRKNF